MQNAQLKLYIVQFAYSGNGGVASSIPEIGKWLFKLGIKISKDDRISSAVGIDDICDTPITMTRNAAVQNASDVASVECQVCPAGRFLLLDDARIDALKHVNISQCLPCEPGKFASSTASASCEICDGGRYTEDGTEANAECTHSGIHFSMTPEMGP